MADIIYKSNNCPGCITLENALANSPIPGVYILNIDSDPQARLNFNATGSRAVPTGVINNQVFIGAHAITQALRMKYGRP